MATPTGAIWRLRRARGGKTVQFEQYKQQYLEIIEALKTVGGEDAVSDLSAWMIDFTNNTQQLPTPTAVRTQARRLCSDRGLSIPDSSTLVD